MRKYRNLLFLTALLLSILGLLIYRSEYNKLRYTFGILDFINVPISSNNCLILNESVVNYNYKHLFSSYPREWVQMGDYFIYSAFWVQGQSQSQARAIGVGPLNGIPVFSCNVWFDHQDTLFSLHGQFSYSTLPNNTVDHSVYEFICEVEISSRGIPYIFVLILNTGGTKRKFFIPIFHSGSTHVDFSNINRTGICVKPDRFGFSKNDIVEFISFHKVIGFSDLIVYDNGIHYGILNKLKKLENLESVISSISILSWNFPYEDSLIENQALMLDCLSRTSGILSVVGVLEWNKYIVPKENKLISDIFKSPHPVDSKMFTFPSQVCCTNYKNDKRTESSWPMVLRKTHCRKVEDEIIIALFPSRNSIIYNNIPQSLNFGVLNIFNECKSEESFLSHDFSTHNFVADIMDSKLIKIWKSGQLFTRN